MRGLSIILPLGLVLQGCGPKEDHTPPVTASKEMRAFYLQNCTVCRFHTDHESGVRYGKWIRGAPTYYGAAWLERRSDAELMNTIRNGIPGTIMPSFGRLTEEDLRQIVQGILRPLSHRKPSKDHGFLEQVHGGSVCTERCL